jgi:hypothetical protein
MGQEACQHGAHVVGAPLEQVGGRVQVWVVQLSSCARLPFLPPKGCCLDVSISWLGHMQVRSDKQTCLALPART